MDYAIGVDIGGTKVAAALISNQGQFDYYTELPSDVASAEALFTTVTTAIDQVLAQSQLALSELKGIGVGLPGKVDIQQGVAVFQNNIPWADFPVVDRLRQHYAVETIKIDNDVKVAAYAEYRLSQLAPDQMFGYVTISTGIACTNIVNDTILRGEGFSGEIGFLPVPTSSGLKAMEVANSGPGIQAYAQEVFGDTSLTTAQVFELWQAGDARADAVIQHAATGTCVGLYAMICLLDPAKIVLGGSVVVKNPAYVALIKSTLEEMMHPEQLHVLEHIVTSKLGRHNGIVGAGLLVM